MTGGAGRRIPGEPGVWVLVMGDLMVFGAFFGSFAYYQALEPDMFRASRALLDQPLGLLNTMLLLTSSLVVVLGVDAGRAASPRRAALWLAAAIALGIGFVVAKAVEYGGKAAAGIYPTTNDFFMLYFAFTAVHLLHVLIGIGALAFLRARVERLAADGSSTLEACAIFWHLVDVLWIMLFAVLYLQR